LIKEEREKRKKREKKKKKRGGEGEGRDSVFKKYDVIVIADKKVYYKKVYF